MKIIKAYKTELDPNNKQKTFLQQCAGASRFVYNWGLAEWKRQYESGEKPSEYSLRKKFNAEKDEICSWIRDLPYAVVESSFANLGTAFKNFFRDLKKGKVGYPKFKKKGIRDSFQVKNTVVDDGHIKVTSIGWIKLKEKGYIPTNGKYGNYSTISKKAGRWFVSIFIEVEVEEQSNHTNEIIGVDLGIKHLAVTSDGMVFENPKPYKNSLKKMKRLQRELSRRNKGGSNYNKTKKKLAKEHFRVSNIRQNETHNISSYITKKLPQAIVMEDLNVKGMMRNHRLAGSIADSSFGELRRQIEYKSERMGIDFFLAGRFEPTSKMCSNCGEIKSELTLNDRTYICDSCGLEIDRDLNAAINISNLYEPSNGRELPVELA
jgi:putative transposase